MGAEAVLDTWLEFCEDDEIDTGDVGRGGRPSTASSTSGCCTGRGGGDGSSLTFETRSQSELRALSLGRKPSMHEMIGSDSCSSCPSSREGMVWMRINPGQ